MNFQSDQFRLPQAALSNARVIPLPHQSPSLAKGHRLRLHVFLQMKNQQLRLARIREATEQEQLLVVLPKPQQLLGQIATFQGRTGALCHRLRLLHIDPTKLLILQPNHWPVLKSFYSNRGRIAAKPNKHIQANYQHFQSDHPRVNLAVPHRLVHGAGTVPQNQEYSMDQPMPHNQFLAGEDLWLHRGYRPLFQENLHHRDEKVPER